MGQTLTNGIYLPDEGERNSYSGLEANWRTLDALILTVNGKAAPNIANTWTAAQTFTAGIIGALTGNVTGNVTGDLTGTASKAIADEDGTSIKTGYVNVAGNQTVTGQKTWGGNQFYTAGAYHRNNSYEIGNTPASNVAIPIYFTDKVNVHTGYVRNVILTTGKTQSELLARNKFTSGALSPTGTDVSSTLQVEVQSNGDKTLYFDGSIRNNVLPYATNSYSLGSSSYQWSSVYAQAYYYNGTEFQSKFVTTDTEQSISQVKEFTRTNSDTLRLKNGRVALGETISSDAYTQFVFKDKNTDNLAYIRDTYFADGSTALSFYVRNKYANGAPSTTGLVFYAYWGIGVDATGKPFAFVRGDLAPYSNATYNLGTSTNKWKTLNGINPGALSLPDLNSDGYVDLSGNISANTQYTYTAPSDGWLCLYVQTSGFHAENAVAIFNGAGSTDSHRWANSATSSINLFRMGVYHGAVSVPVRSGNTYFCYVNVDSSTSLSNVFFYFYKAQGNI